MQRLVRRPRAEARRRQAAGEQAEKFGFNENYLTQLPFNASQFPSSVDEPQTALSAIGQFDVAATPLQMAMVAAGIANGGAVMTPYVVAEVRSPDLDVLDKAQPQVLHQAISGSVADELTQMMVDVVKTPPEPAARRRSRASPWRARPEPRTPQRRGRRTPGW